jgi:hypothetical protein
VARSEKLRFASVAVISTGSRCRLQKSKISNCDKTVGYYVTSKVVKGSKNFGLSLSFLQAARKSWKTFTLPRAPSSGLDREEREPKFPYPVPSSALAVKWRNFAAEFRHLIASSTCKAQ